jgi:hypothetical protein
MTFQLYRLARPSCRVRASIDWVAVIGNLFIIKNNITRKTSSGPYNNNSNNYLLKVEDPIFRKY